MVVAALHGYEEIRSVVIDILLDGASPAPNQYLNLVNAVAEIFALRVNPQNSSYGSRLNAQDEEYVRDVFWDLFRLGYITLGMNNSNPDWPFFRLSYKGKIHLESESPWKFHDTTSFKGLVHNAVPDLNSTTLAYLEEAVSAFYANCYLASCVMLGVAAEAEFLRLIDIARNHSEFGERFSGAVNEKFIAGKIKKFQAAINQLKSQLGRDVFEGLDTQFSAIQAIIREARNESGHPSAKIQTREAVYVYLQLFIPFAKKMDQIKATLQNDPTNDEDEG